MRLLPITALVILGFIGMVGDTDAKVYRWVDENGKVHYSDEPKANAEEVDLSEVRENTISLGTTRKITKAPEPEAIRFNITIISPEHEATIRSNEGEFTVTVGVSPELPRGALLALYVDNKLTIQPQTSTVFNLTGVYRGEHSIIVKMLDQSGKVLASSSPRKVFVHQASVLAPANRPSIQPIKAK